MARKPFKLPSVFVGCPYDEKKYGFSRFKDALDRIPFRWYYADTRIRTKHLLGILRSYIKAVDYCIFDVSLWNPNVALEIGLAEGMGIEYYIILNPRLKKGVPSDIQGLQRIEYSAPDGYGKDDLIPRLVHYLVKEQTHPQRIYQHLSGENREKKFYFGLALLAHLRDNKSLTENDIRHLGKGTYLRHDAQEHVIQICEEIGLLSQNRGNKGRLLKKNIFPEPLKFGKKIG